jgi:hypothetical protein
MTDVRHRVGIAVCAWLARPRCDTAGPRIPSIVLRRACSPVWTPDGGQAARLVEVRAVLRWLWRVRLPPSIIAAPLPGCTRRMRWLGTRSARQYLRLGAREVITTSCAASSSRHRSTRDTRRFGRTMNIVPVACAYHPRRRSALGRHKQANAHSCAKEQDAMSGEAGSARRDS